MWGFAVKVKPSERIVEKSTGNMQLMWANMQERIKCNAMEYGAV